MKEGKALRQLRKSEILMIEISHAVSSLKYYKTDSNEYKNDIKKLEEKTSTLKNRLQKAREDLYDKHIWKSCFMAAGIPFLLYLIFLLILHYYK